MAEIWSVRREQLNRRIEEVKRMMKGRAPSHAVDIDLAIKLEILDCLFDISDALHGINQVMPELKE